DTQFAYPYAATAVSPDGRYLVFAAGSAAGTPSLWLRPLDSLVSRPLQGTERGNLPFWSPDSKSIAFFANGKLKRSEVVGGATQVLCDVQILGGGTWSRDGVILFRSPEGLSRVPASGGVPQQVTQRNEARKESGHFMPQFLPDGNRFLYFIRSADSNTQGIYAGSLDRPGERLRLLAANHPAYYVPPRAGRPGFLLWLREQTLLAQGFDLARLRLEGDPTPLTEDILASSGGAAAAFWTSDAGLLVYRTGGVSVKAKLIWMGRDGKRLGEAGNEDRYGSFRISPDGRRLAMGRYDYGNNSDIWVFEFDRGVMTRLTFDPSQDGIPVWSPDGRQVAYFSARSGVRQIFRTDAGGGGKEEQLTNRPNGVLAAYDWSRDGRHLLYTEVDSKTGNDIWGLPLEGERKPIAVLQTSFSESSAQFSPDGKWVAYQSNESGRTDVYVRAFPVSSGQWQLSSEGGTRPRWRADGKELFFLGPGSDKIMAAGIRVEGANLQSDKPRELFSVSPLDTSLGSPYDVTADGQRFLVWQPSNAEQQGPAPLTVVTNWQARLKR
ncbi:MAG TPA: hypothetical protein VLH09_09010, partial [Bryobacteraceae bacterium]|nr:hypothetical protein [Bryobacteraceae bacterium]